MGYHECEFWDLPRPELPIGNGEIHVPGAARTIAYAAPQMLPHYVEAHRYLPPGEFIEAVLAYRAPEIPWQAIRTCWESQMPPLEGNWNQWRFFSGGSLCKVFAGHEMSVALDYLQRGLEATLSYGYARDFALEVARSCSNPQGGAIEIEQSRHEINCGSFSPSVKSCTCDSVPLVDYDAVVRLRQSKARS